MTDEELLAAFDAMDPQAIDCLRRAMRAEQAERDELAEALLRTRSPSGILLTDLVDAATLDPEFRRQLARVLGQLQARPG